MTDGGESEGDVYDWWSRHPRALGALYAVVFLGRERAIRRQAMAALAPEPGERVLEVGCGTGNGFAALREDVGPDGAVVGVDASRGMVRAARDRIREAGWGNVHAVRGDARNPPVRPGSVDAAYAAMSLSAVPDPAAAVAATADALAPGGRLVVLDARPFPRWPWRAANPLVVPVAELATAWEPGTDLLAALRAEFDGLEVSAHTGGAVFVARARLDDQP